MADSSKPDPQGTGAAKPPPSSRKKAAGAPDGDAKPLKILLVDHSRTMRSILKSTLHSLAPSSSSKPATVSRHWT